MKRNKKKAESQTFARITVLVPVIISLLSLVFGGWQYFEKRQIERILLRKTEAETSIQIEQCYIDAKLLDIYVMLRFAGEDKEVRINRSIQEEEFDQAYIKWLIYLEQHLPWKVKLIPIKNICSEQLLRSIQDRIVLKEFTLYLIRNAGQYNLKDLKVSFKASPNKGDDPIEVGLLAPGQGAIFIIENQFIQSKPDYFTRLEPGREGIVFLDDFRNTKGSVAIRPRFEQARLIAPGINWAK
jgi:hypothetical protein